MVKVTRLTARLRAEYAEQQQQRIDDLVVAHMHLVKTIAQRVWRRYTQAGQDGYSSHIEIEDMIACGHVGLVEAARRYKPAQGDFPKFAFRRIRGAMIDAHRRGAYRDMQHSSIEAADAELRDRDDSGATPRSSGPGRTAALTIAAALRDPAPLPDALMAQKELEKLAARAIRQLPDGERIVLIDALGGADLAGTAAARGRSVAWARAKLASAREKVAEQVRREQRAA